MKKRVIKKMGRWMEEYKHCSHSYVASKQSELPGYCLRCGTDRKYIIRLPVETEVGDDQGREC